MAEAQDIPAWIALFLGLYSLAAAVGELREPGGWTKMLEGFEENHALRFLTGIFCMTLGAAIYLVTPWRPGDWLSIAVSAIGGLCAIEGMLILAAGDRFLGAARKLFAGGAKGWAGFAALFGAASVFVALSRLHLGQV